MNRYRSLKLKVFMDTRRANVVFTPFSKLHYGLHLHEIMKVSWPYFDPDFDTLSERMYGPKVSIDNDSMQDFTIIKVDGVNRQGILLEVVQILTDMNLSISKSYISADGTWFMDVFHVKDKNGNKLRDQRIINYIQEAIGETSWETPSSATNYKAKAQRFKDSTTKNPNCNKCTVIEMSGTDRPGLLLEISTTLADLECNIVEAHAWTHNARLACVASISDRCTNTSIDDPKRLSTIEECLRTVLRATTATSISTQIPMSQLEAKTEVEHRLHQLMLSAGDFDDRSNLSSPVAQVMVEDCVDKKYSMVIIKCKDRPRLMFDCVCTLTDMKYVIFHASTSSSRGRAFQEYFVRRIDGSILNEESEKEHLKKCMEAALERRVFEGVRLEVRGRTRVRLLSDIARFLRQKGLDLVRADVATLGGEKAVNGALYVRDISGNKNNELQDLGFLEESIETEMMMAPQKLAVMDDDVTEQAIPLL